LNLGASTSWNPLGLSGLVMGLLHIYLFYLKHTFRTKSGTPLVYNFGQQLKLLDIIK